MLFSYSFWQGRERGKERETLNFPARQYNLCSSRNIIFQPFFLNGLMLGLEFCLGSLVPRENWCWRHAAKAVFVINRHKKQLFYNTTSKKYGSGGGAIKPHKCVDGGFGEK